MADKITFPVLEEMLLASHNTDYQQLLLFIRRHIPAINTLHLDEVSATGCNSQLQDEEFCHKVVDDLEKMGFRGAHSCYVDNNDA